MICTGFMFWYGVFLVIISLWFFFFLIKSWVNNWSGGKQGVPEANRVAVHVNFFRHRLLHKKLGCHVADCSHKRPAVPLLEEKQQRVFSCVPYMIVVAS